MSSPEPRLLYVLISFLRFYHRDIHVYRPFTTLTPCKIIANSCIMIYCFILKFRFEVADIEHFFN